MLSVLALVLLAQAAPDPWGRPHQLRAVAGLPASLEHRGEDVPVRLWWAGEGRQDWQVEGLLGGRWRLLSREAAPGWTSRAVPAGTSFRVKGATGVRWSAPIRAMPGLSPEHLARLLAPEGALLARTVGQVVVDGDRVVVSTLGGGLALVEGEGEPVVLGTWEGLPSPWVVAVDAREGALLAGTQEGAWFRDRDGAAQVVRESLASAYVQAVLLDGDRRWLGTDAGLWRWGSSALEEILRPDAVFSLGPDAGGEALLVGYRGWGSLPRDLEALGPVPQAARPGVDPVPPDPGSERLPGVAEVHYYELKRGPDGVIAGASPELGLVALEPSGPTAVAGAPPSALGFDFDGQGRLWIAGAESGLVVPGLDTVPWPWQGRAGITWDVAIDGQERAWVATDRGLGRLEEGPEGGFEATLFPVSPWTADLQVRALAPWRGRTILGGPEGLAVLGSHDPALEALQDLTEGPVLGLSGDRQGLWVVDQGGVSHLDARGRLLREASTAVPRAAVSDGDGLLVATDGGLQRWSRGVAELEVELLTVGPSVSGLRQGRDLWTTDGARLQVAGPGGDLQRLEARGPQVLAAGEGGVWVGAWDGLWWADRQGMVQLLEGVQVTAVLARADGGCVYGTAHGQVGRVGSPASSPRPWRELAHPIEALVADGDEALWVLSAGGSWWLPALP